MGLGTRSEETGPTCRADTEQSMLGDTPFFTGILEFRKYHDTELLRRPPLESQTHPHPALPSMEGHTMP